MLLYAVACGVERIINLVFNRVDVGRRMLLGVLDELSGVLFEMVCSLMSASRVLVSGSFVIRRLRRLRVEWMRFSYL
jgi:hypothetical protein